MPPMAPSQAFPHFGPYPMGVQTVWPMPTPQWPPATPDSWDKHTPYPQPQKWQQNDCQPKGDLTSDVRHKERDSTKDRDKDKERDKRRSNVTNNNNNNKKEKDKPEDEQKTLDLDTRYKNL